MNKGLMIGGPCEGRVLEAGDSHHDVPVLKPTVLQAESTGVTKSCDFEMPDYDNHRYHYSSFHGCHFWVHDDIMLSKNPSASIVLHLLAHYQPEVTKQ